LHNKVVFHEKGMMKGAGFVMKVGKLGEASKFGFHHEKWSVNH